MKIKLIVLILLSLTVFGCKNDLVINAPYKNIASIYCFLDQNEPIQYIRIQKLYQNNVNSSTSAGAQIVDSLYFDSLIVKLINVVTRDTFNCYKVDTIPKDKGIFSSAKNTLYATTIPKNNASDQIYQLLAVHPKSNTVFSSQITLVRDAEIELRLIVINTTIPNYTFAFRFVPGANAVLYDLIVRYQYKEMNKADTNVFVIKNVDYYAAKSASISQNGSSQAQAIIPSTDFVNYLVNNVPVDNTKLRRTLGIIYQAYGGSKEFAALLDLSNPNLSVVKKNTEYSNITNALGIFSSRNFVELQMVVPASTIKVIESQLPNFQP